MTEVALGGVFIAAYLYLFSFLHAFGPEAELRMLWVKELPPVALNVVGWWLWIWHRRSQNAAWRQAVGWLGLIGNALAICLPFLAFKYDAFVFTRRGGRGYPPMLPVSGVSHIRPTLRLCLVLSVVSLIIGFLAPKRIRLAVVLGGFTSTWFFMSLPVTI